MTINPSSGPPDGGINDAVNGGAVNPGDTLVLTAGTYSGINNYGVNFNKPMTVRGASGDPADAIIQGGGAISPIWTLGNAIGNPANGYTTVTIQALTFTGAGAGGAHPNLALYDHTNLILQDVVFEPGNGIYVGDDGGQYPASLTCVPWVDTSVFPNITHPNPLSVSSLQFVQSSGGTVSADIGTLDVNMATALTVDGTAAANIVIDTVTVEAGQTLTVTSLNGGQLTVHNLTIASGGSVTGDVDAIMPAVGLSSSTLPNGTANAAYTPQSIAANASGVGPFSFALAAGSALPTGMTLDADGTIGGTPTAAAAALSFDVTVTDALGRTATNTYAITIASGIGNPNAAVPALGEWALVLLALLLAGGAAARMRRQK